MYKNCVCVYVSGHAPEHYVCAGLCGGWGGGFPLMEKQTTESSEYLGSSCQPYGTHIHYVIHSKVKRLITGSLCTSQMCADKLIIS